MIRFPLVTQLTSGSVVCNSWWVHSWDALLMAPAAPDDPSMTSARNETARARRLGELLRDEQKELKERQRRQKAAIRRAGAAVERARDAESRAAQHVSGAVTEFGSVEPVAELLELSETAVRAYVKAAAAVTEGAVLAGPDSDAAGT